MNKLNSSLYIFLTSLILIISCKKYEPKTKAVILTGTVKNIYAVQATSEGSISGIGDINIVQHGYCWSSANDVPDFRINQGKMLLGTKKTDGNFSSTLLGLYPNTTYYLRSFYLTPKDTIYGNDIQVFTTKDTTAPLAPNVATGVDSAVKISNFYIKGSILNKGSSNIISYGHCYSTSNSQPTILDNKTNLGTSNTILNYTSNITGLIDQTKYYVRAYATNTTGTAYGIVLEVTTLKNISLATITTIDSFEFNGWNTDFKLFGNLNSAGNDIISSIGHVYSTDGNTQPIVNDYPAMKDPNVTQSGIYNTKESFNKLKTLTTYNYRAFAENSLGVAYGNTYSYTTGFKGNIAFKIVDQNKSYGTVSAVYNGEMYYGLGIISDLNQQPTIGQWGKYNPKTNTYTYLKDCPYAISFGNCFEYEGIIYIIGGLINGNGNNLSILFSYNPSSDAWSIEKTYNFPFWGSAGFLIKDIYYLSGGTTQTGGGNSISSFMTKTMALDMQNYSLTNVKSLPSDARSNAAAFTVNGIGYVVAGMKNYSSPVGLSECWAYNPEKDEWNQKANVPLSSGIAGVAFGAASNYGEFGYFIGGIQNYVPNLNLSRYNPIKNTWKVIQNIPNNKITSIGTANFVEKKLVYGTGMLGNGSYTSSLFILD